SVCIYKGAHLGIDTLILALEKRGIKALTFIVRILTIVFSIVFLILSTQITMKIYGTGQLSAVMRLPMYLVYAALPVSGFLMTLRFIQEFIEEFLVKKEK